MSQDSRQLIRQAFQQAQDSGKPDWYRMSIAVLKNRILGITNGLFKESDHQAQSFTAFVDQFPDVIVMDKSRMPYVVELVGEHGQPTSTIGPAPSPTERTQAPFPTERTQVRGDLWRATLDYSGGNNYVWDATIDRARLATPNDDLPKFNTITQQDERRWRSDFVNSITSRSETVGLAEVRLTNWAALGLPTSDLPRPFIPKWNRYIRERVYGHICDWFQENKLAPPVDLLTAHEAPRSTTSETDQLRQLILRVVNEMDAAELSRIDLPPRAVLKASRTR